MTSSSSGDPDARDFSAEMEADLHDAEALVRAGDPSGAFDRYLHLVQRYLEHERPLEAAAIGFRALAVDPSSFTAGRVATTLRTIGDAAVPLCRRSIREHLAAERTNEAVDMAEILLWLDPQDDETRRQLGELYAHAGRVDEGLALLESTCERLAKAGRDRELIATARVLLRLAPDHRPALRKLTRACLRLGHAAAALAAATRIVAHEPQDADGLELLARVYVELDRPLEALDALGRLTDAASEQADRILVRALLWRPEPQFHRGVAHLRARLRARATAGSTDPLAAVPDAPELLDDHPPG